MSRRPRVSRLPLLLPALALAAAVILYLPTVGGGWLCDDFMHLDQAQTIPVFQHPLAALTKGIYYYFRPWPSLWWSLIYAAFGFNPLLYRVGHLAHHLLVALAVYALTRRVVKDRTAAGMAALLFAVFPLHAEAVTWVSANTDLWVTFFIVLTLERYLRWRDAPTGNSGTAAAAMAMALLALWSKETAFVLPGAIVLTEILAGARRDRRARLLMFGLILGLAAAAYALKFALALGNITPPGLQPPTAWPRNMLNTLTILATPSWDPRFGRWAGPVMIAAAAAAAGLAGRRPLRFAIFGAMVGLAFLALPGAMGGVGRDFNFSRMFYLPSAGFCLGLGALFARPAGPNRIRGAARAVTAAILVGMFFLAASVNLRPGLVAGHASRQLERAFLEATAGFQEGDAIRVEGVPMILNGVWFFPNSYELSVAFSIWRFPQAFAARDYDHRHELPVNAVSVEVPDLEAKMNPIKRLRELKTAPVNEFKYRMVWQKE
jgi:hypothetical protein